jgi:flagellar hook-basal body complex protein FliE
MSAVVAPSIGSLPLSSPHIGELTSPHISETPGVGITGAVPHPEQIGGPSFGEVFTDALASANQKNIEATNASKAFADGVRDDIHGTMIALKEADIELKLVSNVRTKMVDAFNDLFRMSI